MNNSIEKTNKNQLNAEPFSKLVDELKDKLKNFSDPEQQLAAMKCLKKMVILGINSLNDAIIQNNIQVTLVRCLEEQHSLALQSEAVIIISQIANGTAEQIEAIVAANAVPALINLIKQAKCSSIGEEAIWALGNIIGEGTALRDLVIQNGAIPVLCAYVEPDKLNWRCCWSTISWVFCNLCRKADTPLSMAHIKQLLPALNALIVCIDENIAYEAIWSIVQIIQNCDDVDEDDAQIRQLIIDSGILLNVLQMLKKEDERFKFAAIRIVGHIAHDLKKNIDYLLKSGVMDYFSDLLAHANRKIRKETVWALSKFTAGSVSQIQKVINAKLLPRVIEILDMDVFSVQIDAARAICNISIHGTRTQMFKALRFGAMPPLIRLLNCNYEKLVKTILLSIKRMLNMGNRKYVINKIIFSNGVDIIEKLQKHSSEEIYEIALNLIEQYF